MGRGDICALCDEYSVKHASEEKAAAGMGRCLARAGTRLADHVDWDERACVSFRLDRVNLVRREQYIQVQKLNRSNPP
jgi:hypothetical protein